MNKELFFNEIASQLSVTHPEIFMELADTVLKSDFLNKTFLNDEASELLKSKYGISPEGLILKLN